MARYVVKMSGKKFTHMSWKTKDGAKKYAKLVNKLNPAAKAKVTKSARKGRRRY